MNILRNVFESGDEKVVIFSQWERMARLIAAELDKIGVRYEYLHGGVPSEKRKDLMQSFTENPESCVFISTDAGSTGLNLQVASILINIDLLGIRQYLNNVLPAFIASVSNVTSRSSTWWPARRLRNGCSAP